VMRDASGFPRQHGEAPNTAGDSAPVGDTADEADASGALTDDAAEAFNRVTEPEQVHTDRIDIGTPAEEDPGEAANDQEDDDE
jgi:hypothetical protein